jgi:heme a synthase
VLLVVLTTILVFRAQFGPRGTERAVVPWFAKGAWITAIFVAITVIFGILTTGSGPHAGDNSDAKSLAPRNGLDPVTIQHIHSIPAYVTFGLTVLLVIAAWLFARRVGQSRRLRVFVALLLLVEVAQIIVGITQADEGLPIVLVNIHLVLAGLLVAAMSAVILSLRVAQPQVEAGRTAREAP